jgi:hypothetical protein
MSASRWTLGQRFAFRFLFLFYLHFALTSAPLARLPGVGPWLGRYAGLWNPLAELFGRYAFDLETTALLAERGVDSSLYGWILLLCILSLAALGALVWSLLDRRREHHLRLQAWFRWLQRLVVSCALIHYGMIKVVPTQMIAPPPPGVLLFRVGDLVPNHLLWWFMGASPTFESITGLAELAAGLLLLAPRTVLLGGLLATADLLTVFAINLGYDVPVKIYSLQLLILSILLVLPDRKRLADLFLFNRRVEPAEHPPLAASPRRHRAAQLALLAFGLFFIVQSIGDTRKRYEKLYPPRPPFFGAWAVESFVIDGREVPPFTDPERWRWVTVARPAKLAVERMNGAPLGFQLEIDPQRRMLSLAYRPAAREGNSPTRPEPPLRPLSANEGTFSYLRPNEDLLILEGQLDGRRARILLRKMELIRQSWR